MLVASFVLYYGVGLFFAIEEFWFEKGNETPALQKPSKNGPLFFMCFVLFPIGLWITASFLGLH